LSLPAEALATTAKDVLAGDFAWTLGKPVLTIDAAKLPPSADNPWYAVKDPSIVRVDGKWHLFATLRKTMGSNGMPPGYIRIGTMSFSDWKDAQAATWHVLDLYPPGDSIRYHGAPQVFHFTPQKTWYLVFQWENPDAGKPYGAYYSTTTTLDDPTSWSLPQLLHAGMPAGLDHWVICDDSKAYHFYTNLDGTLWRAETALGDFPAKWSTPVVALKGDFFEASHTYALKGLGKYLTFIDTIGGGKEGVRFQEAFIADSLGGAWAPLAATKSKSFASLLNVMQTAGKWTDTIDHGELVRVGFDEHLEVDPDDLQFLFQGAAGGGSDYQLGLAVGLGNMPDAGAGADAAADAPASDGGGVDGGGGGEGGSDASSSGQDGAADGGTEAGSGGCGCAAASASASWPVLFAAALMAAFSRKKRR